MAVTTAPTVSVERYQPIAMNPTMMFTEYVFRLLSRRQGVSIVDGLLIIGTLQIKNGLLKHPCIRSAKSLHAKLTFVKLRSKFFNTIIVIIRCEDR